MSRSDASAIPRQGEIGKPIPTFPTFPNAGSMALHRPPHACTRGPSLARLRAFPGLQCSIVGIVGIVGIVFSDSYGVECVLRRPVQGGRNVSCGGVYWQEPLAADICCRATGGSREAFLHSNQMKT